MSRRLDVGTLVVCAVFFCAGAYALHGASAFTELGAIFPRVVALAVVVASIVVAGLSLVGSRTASTSPAGGLPAGPLLVAGAMAAWVAVLPYLGFLLSGTLAFVAIAALIPSDTLASPRSVAKTTVIGAAICGLFYGLLRYGLNVPLPRGLLGFL